MKHCHYILLLLALLLCQNTRAQFNPEPPDEPGARPWLLTLKAVPADAGYFNLNQQSRHIADEVILLTAYSNNGYRFVCWEDSLGNTLTTERNWKYTMPQENVTLTARYEYDPNTPDEPGQASIKKRLFLKTNPADAGWFNLGSTNNISVGQTVHLQVYGRQNYTFRNWTENGTIISSAAAFTYTMPDKDATLTANFDFDYQPGTPDEPGQPQLQTCIVYAMREDAMAGQTCTFPLYFENNGSDVTGFSVDVSFPQSVSASANDAVLTGSVASHQLSVSQLDASTWHFDVRGSSAIEKGDGKALLIPISIPSTASEGNVHAVTLKNGIMVKTDGGQTNIKVRNGSLKIVRAAEEKPDSPDYVVTDVQTTSSNVSPGDEIGITWKVKNQGKRTGLARWTEHIYLVSSTGRKVSIGTSSYDNGQLQPEETVSRSATLVFGKMPGIDGKLNLAVTVIPATSAGETADDQQNNTTQTTGAPVALAKCLYLTLPEQPQVEGSVKTIRCQLARSGDWQSNETFTVTKLQGDDRVSIPEAVFIPRDQAATYFYLPMADNDTYDTDTIVSFSVEGNGYPAVTGQLVIEDDEQPALSVTTSKSVVSEGETFQLTITASRAPAEDLTVMLASENTKRFTYPRKAIIPAGQTSVTVDVTAKDDDLPGQDLSNAFIASAARYTQGEVIVVLQDNDMPVLQLTLTPNKIAEGAGPVSVAGTLRRTGVTSNKITVRLSDDSNGGLYFGTRELTLNAGVEEISFNFGPVDNTQVDGDRTYTVTAAVWLSSCSCSAAGQSAGSVSAQLHVLDDDGPALTLSSTMSTIKEGGKATLTVSRNTTAQSVGGDLQSPLTVHLSSDCDENLSYNHTVNIPAGQQTAQVEVTSTKNDISDDSHTVVFTAQAEGFATGTCWLMVTDQTLPDAVITSISVDKSEVEAGGECHINIIVVNRGFSSLPILTPISLYFRGKDDLVGQMYTQAEVLPGDTISVNKSLYFHTTVGNHSLFAVINESRKHQELQYTNNISDVTTIHVIPSFNSTVKVEKSEYFPDETININGVVSNKDISNAEVEVYFLNNGMRQSANTTVNENGLFSLNWKPLKKQIGHFIVGACAPGEEREDSLTSFEIIGLQVVERYTTIDVDAGATVHDSLLIFNPCGRPLTDIHIKALDSCNIKLASQSIDKLNPKHSAYLRYSIVGGEPTGGNDWQNKLINVTCQEGGRSEHLLYYYVHSPKARIVANTNAIHTTATIGKFRDFPITIKNMGQGVSGQINIDTGDSKWLSCVTAENTPSLSFGDSTTVLLRISVPEDIPANSIMEGHIAVNCESGTGCMIDLSIEIVSEETGSLTVDVWDEYTYFTNEAPHVAEASVRLLHPVSGQLLVSSTTNTDGICVITLPDGFYTLCVEKEGHESFVGSVRIDPGTNKRMRVTILLETIQVSLNFEETEIDDMYRISTTIEYETNVPTPVVLMNLPDSIPLSSMLCGESILIEAILTNKGLIKASETHLEFPEIPGLRFEILDNDLIDLLPLQSVKIPVQATRYCALGDNDSSHNVNQGGEMVYPGALLSDIPCYIPVYLYYGVDCNERKYRKGYSKYLGLKPCMPSEITTGELNVVPQPGGGGGGGGGEIAIRSGNRPIIMADCDYKYNNAYAYLGKFIECFAKGIYRNLPVFGPGFNIAFCLDDIEQCAFNTNRTSLECTQSLMDCLNSFRQNKLMQIASPITSFNGCEQYLQQFIDSVRALPPGTVLTSRKDVERNKAFPDYIYEYQERISKIATAFQGEQDYLLEVFGNEVFLSSEVQDVLQLLAYVNSQNNEIGNVSNNILNYKPDNVSEEHLMAFVERISNTVKKSNGEVLNTENYIHDSIIASAIDKIASANSYTKSHGFESMGEMLEMTISDVEKRQVEQRNNICARVTMQIEQTMTMSRPAIRAKLVVKNGHDSIPMSEILLNIIAKSSEGIIATEHEFHIMVDSLNGLQGAKNFSSGWTLDAQQTGTATILFIPTKYAAPEQPVAYSFGGSLTYIDPFTGMKVEREFIPQVLTVNPLPDLELTYLMQRDVYGDDPLTEDVVEPMEEAEFALIINNKGNGEAKNVRMLTEQPKIIENEKGLFINFDIVSSQVNGEPANLALGQTIANDFGTIGAHSQAYAQWWLRSTLLGHFTSYEVEAKHVTSYGNADLSLVDTVTIHEMVRGFTPMVNVQSSMFNVHRGWLVNDIVDADDMPDVVYFADATQQPLYMATGSIERLGNSEFRLIITPKQAGWNYGSVTDPTGGRREIAKIVRQSDGAELPVDNVWQTDRTLRDGRDWLYENRLHFVGDMQTSGETYVLTFEEGPEVELAVQEFVGVPPEGTIQETPLDVVTVRFNKGIKEETFTSDDLTLLCQGERQDETVITISKQSDTDYLLNLSQVNRQDGYYVLTVQTAGITDSEGFNGRSGKSVSWVQYIKTIEPETCFYVTTTPAGYATFYDSQMTWQLPAELQACVVTDGSTEKLTYARLDGSIVPKGVAVMLESTPKQAGTHTLTATLGSVASYNGTNLLRGSDVATMATPGSGEQLYKLAYGPSGTKWSNVFGWYWGAEGGGAFQIEGHKAWLAVPAASGARLSGYDIGGEALDIEGMAGEAGEDTIFDLQGRRVNNSRFTVHNTQLRKGIYVRNGQKVIIK